MLVLLAITYFIIDVKQWRRGLAPALIFGTNPIVAFTISTVLTSLGYFIYIHSSSQETRLNAWLFEHWFLPHISPVHASLAYALCVVLLNLALVYPLYRKRIFIRV